LCGNYGALEDIVRLKVKCHRLLVRHTPWMRTVSHYSWSSLPCRNHQPFRLAIFPLRAELSRCRRSVSPARCRSLAKPSAHGASNSARLMPTT